MGRGKLWSKGTAIWAVLIMLFVDGHVKWRAAVTHTTFHSEVTGATGTGEFAAPLKTPDDYAQAPKADMDWDCDGIVGQAGATAFE